MVIKTSSRQDLVDGQQLRTLKRRAWLSHRGCKCNKSHICNASMSNSNPIMYITRQPRIVKMRIFFRFFCVAQQSEQSKLFSLLCANIRIYWHLFTEPIVQNIATETFKTKLHMYFENRACNLRCRHKIAHFLAQLSCDRILHAIRSPFYSVGRT